MYRHIVLLISMLSTLSTFANSIDIGRQPYINFSHRDYSAHFQNWAVVQDDRGFMYVANNNGVLEYDGNSWRTISINGEVARCLNVDDYGRIWVGTQDELGFLAPDSTSTLVFHSLKHLVTQVCPSIGLVRQVYGTRDGVYFSTNSCLIRILGQEVKVFQPKTFFHRTYNVFGKIFTIQPNVGLTIVNGDSIELVPGGDLFANSKIYALLPYNERFMLIATQSDGMFLYDATFLDDPIEHDPSIFITPFKTSDDNFFIDNWVYWGEPLSNNRFAFGTYRGGAVIINKDGDIIQRIGRNEGIQDETVWYVSADNQDNIWLALNNGISVVAVKSPITTWSGNMAPQGIIQSVKRINGTLYASTNAGVFKLKRSNFEKVKGILDLSWDIVPVVSSDGQEVTLIATGSGVYSLKGGEAKLIEKGNVPTFTIYQSKNHKDIVFLGLYDGLGVATYKNGQWVYVGKFEEIKGRIWRIDEDSANNLWFVHRYQGVVRAEVTSPLSLQFSGWEVYSHIDYNPPFDEDTRLLALNDTVLLSAPTGLYRYHSSENCFKPDSSLGERFTTGNTGIKFFNKDDFGYLWFEFYSKPYVRTIARAKVLDDGSFLLLPAELNEIPPMIFTSVDTDSDGINWISGSDGLYRFDPKISMRGMGIPKVYIRSVANTNGKLLFGGTYPRECPDGYFSCIDADQSVDNIQKLSYNQNSLVISFSSPMFGLGGDMLYSYMLEGFDSSWSAWSATSFKEYTNLPAGEYAFKVKSKSIHEVESSVATYSFIISRPWYFHPFMYFVYIALAGMVVTLSVAIKTRMLKVSNQRLQKLVDVRTREILKHQEDILMKNEELMIQKEEIESQRDELEHRNKQTKSSIEYAQTIQQAILPSSEVLDSHFANFVLYQPKDVVSGDFYWFTKVVRSDGNIRKFFAVVDCTGHGVPGAFMSMIGSRLLSEIVNERKIYSPAKVLSALNGMLNKILKQESNDSFDGMDVALCSVEQITAGRYLVTYSGANRPFVLHRKGATNLTIIKGNRKSIGGILPDIDAEFDNHLVDLETGDTLFFFTDGYSDQNNSQGCKFTTQNLYGLLINNINQPIEKIGKVLLSSYKAHKGDSKQRDDITVVGLRLL